MLGRMREMDFSDLAFAVECTRARGRISETVEEFKGFLLHDAKGCLVAEQGRRPVGFCIATLYDTCAFLGAIALRGIESEAVVERELLDHAVGYILSCRSKHIFAEAENSSVPTFESAGFIKLCRILRFVGNVYGRTHQHVRAFRSQDLSAIIDLDRHSFRANRWYFLERRYSLAPQFCKVIEMNGRIVGYITAHSGKGVVTVGPWVVSSKVDCPADLLEGLAMEANGERLVVEVLETNRGAVELLRAMGFTELPESPWRMLRGRWSNVGLADSLFATGSPFIG